MKLYPKLLIILLLSTLIYCIVQSITKIFKQWVTNIADVNQQPACYPPTEVT